MTKQPLMAIVREAAPFICRRDRGPRADHVRSGDRPLAAALMGYKG